MHLIYQAESHLTNRLPQDVAASTLVIGIVGSNPSTTAMSPGVWQRVFRGLVMDCIYVSFDVDETDKLAPLADKFRQTDNFAGFNVTVPYKMDIMAVLDRIEPRAEAIGAVNTVVREADGALVGYNTDGRGALDNVCTAQPGYSNPLIKRLAGKTVLMIGAGGAAKAAGFFLAETLQDGVLFIANRTEARASKLASRIAEMYPDVTVEGVHISRVAQFASQSDLIYNMSTIGQGGVLQSKDGYTILESFSPLGPAETTPLTRKRDETETGLRIRFIRQHHESIVANLAQSLRVIVALPEQTVVADAIHTPAETVLLTQARQAGLRIVNGKGMNLGQALDGFYNKIMASYLEERGWRTPEKRGEIRRLMRGRSS